MTLSVDARWVIILICEVFWSAWGPGGTGASAGGSWQHKRRTGPDMTSLLI